MATPFEHVTAHPDFRRKSREEQRAFLAQRAPWFAEMAPDAQESFLDERVPADYKPLENVLAKNLMAGFEGSVAGSEHLLANTLDMAADWIGKGEGAAAFRTSAEGMRARAAKNATLAGELAGDTVPEKVLQVIGALPVSLGTAAAAVKLAGPVVGFGIMGYLGARDQGLGPAVQRAAIDASIGALFPITQHMHRATRAAVLGVAAGGVSEQQGADRAIEAATMGILAAMPGIKSPSPLAARAIPGLGTKFRAAQRATFDKAKGDLADQVSEARGDEIPGRDTHPFGVWIEATTPEGDVKSDYVRGANRDHAMRRASEAWPGSKIKAVEGPTDSRGQPIRATNAGELLDEGGPAVVDRRVKPGPAEEARALAEGSAIERPPRPGLTEDLSRRVRGEHDPETPREGSMGGSARVLPSGNIEAWHVTDDPAPLYKVLTSHQELSESGRGGMTELGQGLYASGIPMIWTGRARGKWSFLDELTADQKMLLSTAIKSHPNAQRGYISAGEREVMDRDLDSWTAGGGASPVGFSDQPYNIRFWEPSFLEPLGIAPSRQPQVLPIEARGRFAEVESGLGPEDVAQLRAAGFDGAFQKGGMGSTAQLSIWNRHALRRVGEWRPDPEKRGIRFERDESGEPISDHAVDREMPSTPEEPRRTPEQQQAFDAREDLYRWDPEPVESREAMDVRALEIRAGKKKRWGAGDRYVPFYDIHPSTQLPDKVVRKGDAIAKLAKVFGIPTSYGPGGIMRERGPLLGYFRHLPGMSERGGGGRGALYVKRWYDLQTAPHEWMHAIGMKRPELALHKDPAIGTATGLAWDDRIGGWTVPGKTHDPAEVMRRLEQNGFPHIAELHRVSYDWSMTEEGMAEFSRLWFTQKEALTQNHVVNVFDQKTQTIVPQNRAPAAPLFASKFNAMVAGLGRRERQAMLEAQKEMHRYREQGGAAAAKGSIGRDKDATNVLHNRVDRFRESVADKFHGALNFERKTFGGMLPDGIYVALRNLAGRSRQIESMMQWGVPKHVTDPNTGGQMIEYVGKSGEAILTPVSGSNKELDRAFLWLAGRRANELYGQAYHPRTGKLVQAPADLPGELRREKLFSREMIDSMLGLADNEMIRVPGQGKMRPRREVYEELFDDMRDWNSRVLDFAESSGVLGPGTRAAWEKWNTEYTFGFFRDFDLARSGAGSSDPLASTLGVQKLYGSTRPLADPFENWMNTYSRLIFAGLENQVRLKLADLVGKDGFPGFFIERIPAGADMIRVGTERIKDALQSELRRMMGGARIPRAMVDQMFNTHGMVDAVSIFLGADKPHGENVMTVLRDGKPEYYRVRDEQLVRALQAMRNPELGMPMKFFNAIRRVRQEAITIDPSFTAANFAKDILMSYVMRRHGGRHLTAAVQAMKQRVFEDPSYRLAIANGGGAATLRGGGIEYTKGQLVSHAQRQNHDPRGYVVMASPRELYHMLQAFGRMVEEGPRLAEFNRARAKGAGAMESSFGMREVSTDFSLRGANGVVQALTNTIPFFGAMIAGADRFYRGVARDPHSKLHTLMKLGIMAGASTALYAYNRQVDPEGYKNEPEWMKDAYWRIPIPRELTGQWNPKFPEDKFHRFYYPRPFEAGSAMALLDRMWTFGLDDPDPITKGLFQHALELAAANFGMHMGTEGFPLPMPAGLDIAVEQFANRVLFTGSPIVPMELRNVDAWKQARASQPEVFKRYGELLRDYPNVPDFLRSPARAEALLRGMFGEIVMYGADAIDRMWLDPEGPAQAQPYRVLTRRFHRAEPRNRNVDEFYRRLELFGEVRGAHRALEKEGDIALLREVRADPEQRAMAMLAVPYDRANVAVQKINKAIARIERGQVATDFAPREKRDRIRELIRERTKIQTRINEYSSRKYREALKQAEGK